MLIVYYDFECSFCYRTIKHVLNGTRASIKLATIQEIESSNSLFLDIPHDELYRYMWLIDTKTSKRYQGYFAFKFIYKHLHNAKLVKYIFSIPFFSDFFGVRIYRLIANNRRVMGCNSQACSIHHNQKKE